MGYHSLLLSAFFFMEQGFLARHNPHRLARMLSKSVSVPSSSTRHHAQPFSGYWGSNTCPHASVEGTLPTGLSLGALSHPFIYFLLT